jgi:GTP-binding protein Era
MQTNDTSYCGMVAIVGRPNVGKSTLLNQLLGQKVSITSRKPQTTRHRILGIYTEQPHQVVFVDTPGLHIEEKRAINRLMNRAAKSSIGDVDMIFFVVDGLEWTADDENVLNNIKRTSSKCKKILIINKVDKIKQKGNLLPHIEQLRTKFEFDDVIPMSANQGHQVNHLLDLAKSALYPSEHFFPEDYVTDRSSRFLASEIIREKLMRFTGDELPYSVTVEIEQFTVSPEGLYRINGLILVERQGQKKMIIGKKGDRIKTIGREARIDMEKMFDHKVFLELWVKVKSGWADDERALRSLGYGDE